MLRGRLARDTRLPQVYVNTDDRAWCDKISQANGDRAGPATAIKERHSGAEVRHEERTVRLGCPLCHEADRDARIPRRIPETACLAALGRSVPHPRGAAKPTTGLVTRSLMRRPPHALHDAGRPSDVDKM